MQQWWHRQSGRMSRETSKGCRDVGRADITAVHYLNWNSLTKPVKGFKNNNNDSNIEKNTLSSSTVAQAAPWTHLGLVFLPPLDQVSSSFLKEEHYSHHCHYLFYLLSLLCCYFSIPALYQSNPLLLLLFIIIVVINNSNNNKILRLEWTSTSD